MIKDRFGFYCSVAPHIYIFDIVGILVSFGLERVFPSDVKRGIRILDMNDKTRLQFSNTVVGALDLIEGSDPLVFDRVRRHIHRITNATGILRSVYTPARKVSVVNIQWLNCQIDRLSAVRLIASILVHDATFGYLLRRGVLRTRRNFDRIDRICCRRARDFLLRLGMCKTPWDVDNLTRNGTARKPSIWPNDLDMGRCC